MANYIKIFLFFWFSNDYIAVGITIAWRKLNNLVDQAVYEVVDQVVFRRRQRRYYITRK